MGIGRDIVYGLALIVASPLWAYRLLSTGKWRSDWGGRFGRGEPLGPTAGKTLLIHAVSVGEVNAIRQLVTEFAEREPATRIVISSTTNTGVARARQLFGPAHAVVRYPLDFTGSVRRFLDRIRPDAVALVELEVWPNFVSACVKRGVPVCVINGRLSARSYKRYRLLRWALRGTFAALTRVAVQTPDYAQRFIEMGVPAERVAVLDSMKWDTAQLTPTVEGSEALASALGLDRRRPIIVAGSTGPGEERLLIDTCPREAQLVLVPRKPERFDEVAALDASILRRTHHPDGSTRTPDERRLFLLDTMGELRKAYALADVCIIGRSFLGLFGSDPIEAVALGKPTIIGPCHADFVDVVSALRAGGGIVVTDQPGAEAAALLADKARATPLAERGRGVILARRGATGRHVEMLREVLAKSARRALTPALSRGERE